MDKHNQAKNKKGFQALFDELDDKKQSRDLLKRKQIMRKSRATLKQGNKSINTGKLDRFKGESSDENSDSHSFSSSNESDSDSQYSD